MTSEANSVAGRRLGRPVELDATLELALDSLRSMVEIGAGSGASGLEVAVDALRLRVDFGAGPAAVSQPIDLLPQAPTLALTQPVAAEDPPAALDELKLVRVGAPLVGVFCQAERPGGEPFCAVGDRVEAGQQLAILEAMKMMNEVVSPCAGTLDEVAVSDGQVVEFGQLLFVIAAD